MTETRHKGLKCHPGTKKDPVMDMLNYIQGNEEINQNVESLEKKPWRKSGANISDYFNYGFDEESWIAYCRKQAKLCGIKRKLNDKNRAQKRHTGYGEEEASCAYSSPGRPSILASRESDPTNDLTGGQLESSRKDGYQCLSDGGSNNQVICEMCHSEDSITAYQLPPPVNMNSLFDCITPTSFLSSSEPQPPSSTASLVSGNSKGFDSPSTSLYPYSSGRITISPGVANTAKAWECYIMQEKRDKDRDRSREHGHDKDSKRGKYREKESCSSSHYGSRSSRDGGEDRDNRRKERKTKRSREEKEHSKMFFADQQKKLKSD